MKKTTNKKWTLPILGLVGCIAAASTSHGAVTVAWHQDGADVTATWSGTLGLFGGAGLQATPAASVAQASGTQLFTQVSGDSNIWGTQFPGITAATGLATVSNSGSSTTSFGFNGSPVFYFNPIHLTGGNLANPAQLTFDPSRDVIRFTGQTLAGMNADSFSNTLAYTAASSDTVSFSTVTAIPEPSGLLLTSLGALALFARRKR